MIQITEPPDVAACSTCMSPLSWLWSAKRQNWVAVIPLDRITFRLHQCRHAQDLPTWRDIPHVHPETVRRGAAKVRAVLLERTGEFPKITEETS